MVVSRCIYMWRGKYSQNFGNGQTNFYFQCVLDTPNGFTVEVNNIIFDYIWRYKNPQLRKTTIIKTNNEGRLNTLDCTLFDKALKIVWAKRLWPNDKRPWKLIPMSLLSMLAATFFSGATVTSNIYP